MNDENVKTWTQSKTIWSNIGLGVLATLSTVATVFLLMLPELNEIVLLLNDLGFSPETVAFVNALLALAGVIANIYLRFITNTGIK